VSTRNPHQLAILGLHFLVAFIEKINFLKKMILKIPECSWKFELSYVLLWGEEKKQRHQLIVEGVTQFRREGAKCRLSVVEEDVERMSGIANIHYSKEDPPQVNVKIHVSKKDLFAFLEQLTIQYPPFKSIEVDFDGSSSVKIGYLKNEERINVSNLTISVKSRDDD
jgi:hypothetical protein